MHSKTKMEMGWTYSENEGQQLDRVHRMSNPGEGTDPEDEHAEGGGMTSYRWRALSGTGQIQWRALMRGLHPVVDKQLLGTGKGTCGSIYIYTFLYIFFVTELRNQLTRQTRARD